MLYREKSGNPDPMMNRYYKGQTRYGKLAKLIFQRSRSQKIFYNSNYFYHQNTHLTDPLLDPGAKSSFGATTVFGVNSEVDLITLHWHCTYIIFVCKESKGTFYLRSKVKKSS
jgi:hypothetical protein